VTLLAVKEQFDQSMRLAEYAEQLVRERKEVDRVINLLIEQVQGDIKTAQTFITQFKELRERYVETVQEFTDQLEKLKSFQELLSLNRQLAEALSK
jgi:hypothetical protein